MHHFVWRRAVTSVVLAAFLLNSGIVALPYAHAQAAQAVQIPVSAAPLLQGVRIYPDDPLRIDFILDKGRVQAKTEELSSVSARLIKYFLAAVTVPEQDLWVNLSPYEKDRIVPDAFGVTEMGRDLLLQDHLLKQITSSLMDPAGPVGKKFWDRIYAEAQRRYGTTEIPVDAFNKVWVVPDKAVVYEGRGAAYVVESRLKVMLDADHTARSQAQSPGDDDMARSILREVIIPVLEQEVNEGGDLAALRQVYQSLILAVWFKDKVKASILAGAFVGQNRTGGIDIDDKAAWEKIWEQYVAAFKQGAFNYIREEQDPATQEAVPRKYFSGGAGFDRIREAYRVTSDPAQLPSGASGANMVVAARLAPVDRAMSDGIEAGRALRAFFALPQREIKYKRAGPFYVMYAPWRQSKHQPEKPYVSVTAPFDISKFHFIQPQQPSGWNFNEQDVFWEGDAFGKKIALIVQKWPFAPRHFLIMPDRSKRRPQIMEQEDIRIAVAFVRSEPFEGFRIGFNSLAAGASVNHFHLQGLQLPEGRSALEEAPLRRIESKDGLEISMVDDYPARGVFFHAADTDVLAAGAYKYIRFLQRSEIAHSVIFTPRGVYVLPEKKNHLTRFGGTWSFYELMGFIVDPNGDQISAGDISDEMAQVTIDAKQLEAIHQTIFSGHTTTRRKLYAEQMHWQPTERYVTEKDADGNITVRGEFEALLGRVGPDAAPVKTFDDLGVMVMLNEQRAGRESAWRKIEDEHDCPLCGLLAVTGGKHLGIGNGFVLVREKYPYFDRTATVVQADHQEPVVERALIVSMAQMLYELGPFGFRIAYNYRGAGQKIKHQSYKIFQRELPIESAPAKPLLVFPEITISTVGDFVTKALVLETKSTDVLVNELTRMEEFLELMKVPFNILLSRRVDGTIRAFVMLRGERDMPAAFANKIFGVVESAGILLLEKKEDFDDPGLRQKVAGAYKEMTMKQGIDWIVYPYKMHMALGRLGMEHDFDYEIDTEGNVFFVCRVPALGEVIKAGRLWNGVDAANDWKRSTFFLTGYRLARRYLGGAMAPFEGVDINERGEFVPSPEDPSYLIQKMVPWMSAAEHIDLLLTGKDVDISRIVSIYEDVIAYAAELLRRGIMDIDFKKFLVNFRGDQVMGFDISHLRAVDQVNALGPEGYGENFEEEFNDHLDVMARKHPVLGKALRGRFGESFSWREELQRRKITVPASPQEGPGVPMQPWGSRIVELSWQGGADRAKLNVTSILNIHQGSSEESILGQSYSFLKLGRPHEVRKYAGMLFDRIAADIGDAAREGSGDWVVASVGGFAIPNAGSLLAAEVARQLRVMHVVIETGLQGDRAVVQSYSNMARKEDRESFASANLAIKDKNALQGKNVIFIDDSVVSGTIMKAAAGLLAGAGVAQVRSYAVATFTSRGDNSFEDRINRTAMTMGGIEPLIEVLNDPDAVYTTRLISYVFELEADVLRLLLERLTVEARLNLYLYSLEYFGIRSPAGVELVAAHLARDPGVALSLPAVLQQVRSRDFFHRCGGILQRYGYRVPLASAEAVADELKQMLAQGDNAQAPDNAENYEQFRDWLAALDPDRLENKINILGMQETFLRGLEIDPYNQVREGYARALATLAAGGFINAGDVRANDMPGRILRVASNELNKDALNALMDFLEILKTRNLASREDVRAIMREQGYVDILLRKISRDQSVLAQEAGVIMLARLIAGGSITPQEAREKGITAAILLGAGAPVSINLRTAYVDALQALTEAGLVTGDMVHESGVIGLLLRDLGTDREAGSRKNAVKALRILASGGMIAAGAMTRRVIDALARTIGHDPDVDVRQAAVGVLRALAAREEIMAGMTRRNVIKVIIEELRGNEMLNVRYGDAVVLRELVREGWVNAVEIGKAGVVDLLARGISSDLDDDTREVFADTLGLLVAGGFVTREKARDSISRIIKALSRGFDVSFDEEQARWADVAVLGPLVANGLMRREDIAAEMAGFQAAVWHRFIDQKTLFDSRDESTAMLKRLIADGFMTRQDLEDKNIIASLWDMVLMDVDGDMRKTAVGILRVLIDRGLANDAEVRAVMEQKKIMAGLLEGARRGASIVRRSANVAGLGALITGGFVTREQILEYGVPGVFLRGALNGSAQMLQRHYAQELEGLFASGLITPADARESGAVELCLRGTSGNMNGFMRKFFIAALEAMVNRKLVAAEGGLSREDVEGMFRRVYDRELSGAALLPYLRMLAIFKDDPAVAYQISGWNSDELREFFWLVDAFVAGVALDAAHPLEGRGEARVRQRLVRDIRSVLSSPSIALARLKERASAALNNSSWRCAVRVYERSSVNAVKGLMASAGLRKDKVVILSDQEMDVDDAKAAFPGHEIYEHHEFKDGDALRLEFHDIGNTHQETRDGVTSMSLSYVPFKYSLPQKMAPEETARLRAALGISVGRQVIVVGSPDNVEFRQFMEAYHALYGKLPHAQRPLIIVGFREARSASELKPLGSLSGQSIVVRNSRNEVWPDMKNNNVLILNTTGELAQMYALRTLAVIGHDRNIAETWGSALYFEGDWTNNMDLKDLFVREGAAVPFSPEDLADLMADADKRRAMAEQGERLIAQYRHEIDRRGKEFAMSIVGSDPVMREQFLGSFRKDALNADKAQGRPADLGGIDLTRERMDIQVVSGGDIKFKFDPAMIERLRHAAGLTPVILDVRPMAMTLPEFLGAAPAR